MQGNKITNRHKIKGNYENNLPPLIFAFLVFPSSEYVNVYMNLVSDFCSWLRQTASPPIQRGTRARCLLVWPSCGHWWGQLAPHCSRADVKGSPGFGWFRRSQTTVCFSVVVVGFWFRL